MKQFMKRNIVMDYIFHFFSNFSLTEAMWVLYLTYKGMSFWEIGLLEGVFHVTSLVSEVPSGAIADLMGRKKVILLSRIVNLFSSIFMLLSTEMWQFVITFVFSAWGYNLLSGSEEAMLYDTFLCLDKEQEYYKANSRLNVILEISQGFATFLGGILAEKGYTYCYVATILMNVISLIPCMLFHEPDWQKEKNDEKVSFRKHFQISYTVIKENIRVREILVFYSIVFTFYTSVYFYSQQYFLDMGISKAGIGFIMLLAGAASCVGALASETIVKMMKEKVRFTASFTITMGIAMLYFDNMTVSILCIACMSFANALLYPLQSASLNQLIPSEQRATIISVSSMVFSVFMIVLFPVMGVLADQYSLRKTFLIVGVIGMGISSIILPNGKGRIEDEVRRD